MLTLVFRRCIVANILEQSLRSLLVRTYYNETLLSTATGFIVNSLKGPSLVTNRHVVTGRDNFTDKPLSKYSAIPNKVVISHNRKNLLGEWIDITEPLINEQGKPLWYEHPILGQKADIAALLLTQTNDVATYPYDLDKPNELTLKPSDIVSVVGFPFGLSVGGKLAIWATGFVASEPEVDYENLPIFLVDCRTREGQSGSAVIAQRNNGALLHSGGVNQLKMGVITDFLGVYSGRINDNSDIGMVWKSSSIVELLRSIK